MQRLILCLVILFVAAVSPGSAQPKKFGIGIVLGAPTGLSVKYWGSSREAVQGYVGGGFGGIAFGADYLFHSNAFDNAHFPFYWGPGVFIGPAVVGGPRFESGKLGLGVRMILGVDYLFPNDPIDIAFEAGPALVLSPKVGAGLEAGLAIRFYP